MPAVPSAVTDCLMAKQAASAGSATGGSPEVPDPAEAQQATAAQAGQEKETQPENWADMEVEDDFVAPTDDTLWPIEASGQSQEGEVLVTAEEVANLIGADDMSSFGGSAAGAPQVENQASGQQAAASAAG